MDKRPRQVRQVEQHTLREPAIVPEDGAGDDRSPEPDVQFSDADTGSDTIMEGNFDPEFAITITWSADPDDQPYVYLYPVRDLDPHTHANVSGYAHPYACTDCGA